ncbi:MAG: tryptophan--tRNA ligase [Holosporales bacterium]|jgi:tryptophanyl-tRNA synthetase|nr:tryptophan--tRNA ligase [Holosporales bacterium]
MKYDTFLTGDRPSGKLHLGHYAGSLKNRLRMQDECLKGYIMVADVQALSDNFASPEKVIKSVVEVTKDYIAVGINPFKITIFIQSLIPELAELTIYYMNMVSVSRLERNPTVKAEIKQKNYGESIPVGFLCYPISQVADITAFDANLVPVGDDQLPMIELTNEVVRRFNRLYDKEVLKEVTAVLSKTQRLIGIDGNAKASKSLGNAIFLADDASTIKDKVYSMFTDPDHIRVSDPGKVDGNVVFTYLDAFFENKEELEELKKHYKKGGLSDISLKSLLNKTLQDLISPIREKRESLKQDEMMDILITGSKIAREAAKQTLYNVKSAMGITYC